MDIVGDEFDIYHISIDEFALVKTAKTDESIDCSLCKKLSDDLETNPINVASNIDINIYIYVFFSKQDI